MEFLHGKVVTVRCPQARLNPLFAVKRRGGGRGGGWIARRRDPYGLKSACPSGLFKMVWIVLEEVGEVEELFVETKKGIIRVFLTSYCRVPTRVFTVPKGLFTAIAQPSQHKIFPLCESPNIFLG